MWNLTNVASQRLSLNFGILPGENQIEPASQATKILILYFIKIHEKKREDISKKI